MMISVMFVENLIVSWRDAQCRKARGQDELSYNTEIPGEVVEGTYIEILTRAEDDNRKGLRKPTKIEYDREWKQKKKAERERQRVAA